MVIEQPHRVEAEGLPTGCQLLLPALLGAWRSEATTTFQAKPRHLAGLEAWATSGFVVIAGGDRVRTFQPHAAQGQGCQGGLDRLGFLPPLQDERRQGPRGTRRVSMSVPALGVGTEQRQGSSLDLREGLFDPTRFPMLSQSASWLLLGCFPDTWGTESYNISGYPAHSSSL